MLNAYEAFNQLSQEDKKRKLKEKNITEEKNEEKIKEKINEFLKWYDENNKTAKIMKSPGGALLLETIWTKELDHCKILLALGFSAYINSCEISALHSAVRAGLSDFVKLLCDLPDVDIDMKDNDGKTALYLAVEKVYPEISTFLLNKGADVTVCANNGKSILDVAGELCKQDDLKITQLIINKNRELFKQPSYINRNRIDDVIENFEAVNIEPSQTNNQFNQQKREERALRLRQYSSLQILITLPDIRQNNPKVYSKALRYEASEEDVQNLKGGRNLYSTVFMPKNKFDNPVEKNFG